MQNEVGEKQSIFYCSLRARERPSCGLVGDPFGPARSPVPNSKLQGLVMRDANKVAVSFDPCGAEDR